MVREAQYFYILLLNLKLTLACATFESDLVMETSVELARKVDYYLGRSFQASIVNGAISYSAFQLKQLLFVLLAIRNILS